MPFIVTCQVHKAPLKDCKTDMLNVYKPNMTSTYKNNISVNTLSPKPGVTVWYSKIPEIIHLIFCKNKYHNFRSLVNEIFQKKDFSTPFLSDEEINTINTFKALKKQIEWISGRYLTKQMIQHVFFAKLSLDQITLSYLEEGAPYLTNSPDIPISLSHSNDYTVAVCSKNTKQTIGIDIEKISKKPDIYFLKTAFTQNEILNLNDDAKQIFTNWTIKEAYLKYIKKGFNESLHKVEIINNKIWHNKAKINVDVFSQIIDNDYVLSLISD
ncbi:MAG: 4'-phosphopantetheinyl transferase superfamily protein [Desulfobacteraceae bacterium]|nr:4'-phosphopantetheinyl transferase superfamily protein [Desulfobacteraceae bacterium]